MTMMEIILSEASLCMGRKLVWRRLRLARRTDAGRVRRVYSVYGRNDIGCDSNVNKTNVSDDHSELMAVSTHT